MSTKRARQVSLTKHHGQIGLRVGELNSGIFVCLVAEGTSAAKAGLHFGDQILRIDGRGMTGLSVRQVHKIFKEKQNGQNFILIVRDRPFERTVNLVRDSYGHLGFQFRQGKIVNIVRHSSAAQNGLLVDHNILEINGTTVVGLKDQEIRQIIDQFEEKTLNVTIMPSILFSRMVREMDGSLFQKMDHSNPSPLYPRLLKKITAGDFLGENGRKF